MYKALYEAQHQTASDAGQTKCAFCMHLLVINHTLQFYFVLKHFDFQLIMLFIVLSL